MSSHVWLHIGSEKTGSTSIQSFLRSNRAELRDRGYVFPAAAGASNQVALCAYALGDRAVDVLGMFPGIRGREDIAAFHGRLERGLAQELAPLPSAAAILSSELCSSRLFRLDEIRRLKSLCDGLAPKTSVVIYIRNQVDFAVSWYSTAVKTGSSKAFQWPPGKVGAEIFDFDRLLARWVEVFGRDNVMVRRFVPEDFVRGDLLEDFSALIGLDTSGLMKPPPANTVLDARCIAFLRAFNRRVPRIENGKVNTLRGPIMKLLEEMSTGAPFVLSSSLAAEIGATYAQSNARVSAAFFGGAYDPLFPPPRYVGNDLADELEADAAIDIAARLWCANMQTIERLGKSGRGGGGS